MRKPRFTWLSKLAKVKQPGGFPNLDLNLNSLTPEPVLLTITYTKEGHRPEKKISESIKPKLG